MARADYTKRAKQTRGPGYTVAELRRMRERACDGCGERFPAREMVEVVADHDSVTFFEGVYGLRGVRRGSRRSVGHDPRAGVLHGVSAFRMHEKAPPGRGRTSDCFEPS